MNIQSGNIPNFSQLAGFAQSSGASPGTGEFANFLKDAMGDLNPESIRSNMQERMGNLQGLLNDAVSGGSVTAEQASDFSELINTMSEKLNSGEPLTPPSDEQRNAFKNMMKTLLSPGYGTIA